MVSLLVILVLDLGLGLGLNVALGVEVLLDGLDCDGAREVTPTTRTFADPPALTAGAATA